MIERFTILGERCSGTNYLEVVMQKNFDVELTWDYGWKHFFGFSDYSDSDDTLFIGIVRDPYTWMNSLFKNKYHIQPELRENSQSFLCKEFWSYYDLDQHRESGLYGQEIMEDRNIYTKERYKNIYDLRLTKLRFLMDDMPTKVSNFILIRYEDLRDNFVETIGVVGATCRKRNGIDYPVNVDRRSNGNTTKKFEVDTHYIIDRSTVFEKMSEKGMRYEQRLGYDTTF